MSAHDLTGQRFGRLIVIAREGSKDRRATWKCQCDCGKEAVVMGTRLRSGNTRSCGCLARENSSKKKLHDHTGKRFGMLTVLRRDTEFTGQGPRWICQCDCGNLTSVRAGNLRSRNISSCGCLLTRKGDKNPTWKGGRYTKKDGYVIVTVLEDGEWQSMPEHRYVMQQFLARKLTANENVHHKNGNRADNQIENLELWVKTQPCGQRVTDLVKFSVDILTKYAPELLKDDQA